MANTNFSVSGTLKLRDEFGVLAQNQTLALIQWDVGYDPRRLAFVDWTTTSAMMNWGITYNATSNKFSSGLMPTQYSTPLYLYVRLGENPDQVGLWQISDFLNLTGKDTNINLNSTAITAILGDVTSNGISTRDVDSWTPTIIPEPNYLLFTAVLLFGGLLARLYKNR